MVPCSLLLYNSGSQGLPKMRAKTPVTWESRAHCPQILALPPCLFSESNMVWCSVWHLCMHCVFLIVGDLISVPCTPKSSTSFSSKFSFLQGKKKEILFQLERIHPNESLKFKIKCLDSMWIKYQIYANRPLKADPSLAHWLVIWITSYCLVFSPMEYLMLFPLNLSHYYAACWFFCSCCSASQKHSHGWCMGMCT